MNNYSFNEDRRSMTRVIDRLSNNNSLSEWEKGFVTNVKAQFDHGKTLTVRQLEALSDLWGKY